MGNSQPEYTDELRHDLHGESVGLDDTLICEYCGASIDTTEPVMCEALRVVNLSEVEKLLDPPADWILDAARCHACEIEELTPATDGFDEALLMLRVNESNGMLSADASTLAVVDISPNGEGYHPPLVNAQLLLASGDPGDARWLRTKGFLERLEAEPTASTDEIELMQNIVGQSKEIPPEIDL
jgi:hypothetical protein